MVSQSDAAEPQTSATGPQSPAPARQTTAPPDPPKPDLAKKLMEPQPAEEEALKTAGSLLLFAAQSPRDVSDAIVAPIQAAWAARAAGQWDPGIATNFWVAYSKLCDLLKPITVDSISTNAPTTRIPWWSYSKTPSTTIASRRTAVGYFWVLLCLLLVAIAAGYVTTTSRSLSDEIRALTKTGNEAADKIREDIARVRKDIDGLKLGDDPTTLSLDDPRLTAEAQKDVLALRTHLQEMYFATDTMYQKVQTLASNKLFAKDFSNYEKGSLGLVPNLRDAEENLAAYFRNRREISERLESVSVWGYFYAALVPILLGTIGASAYVIRLISDQIKDTTFSQTSPIRHRVRVALGALGGAIIGLGLLPDGGLSGLSAGALSFLAGYAVEPVFSTFDDIAKKFRRDDDPAK